MKTWQKYLVYHLRWQAGIIIFYPMMKLMEVVGVPLLERILVSNLVGASVFWYIDKFIFSQKDPK